MNGTCYLCGKRGYIHVHHVYGGSYRKTADLLGLTVDLCGTDMDCAMSSLAEIDGREVTEDIVSDIFAHFCVGK